MENKGPYARRKEPGKNKVITEFGVYRETIRKSESSFAVVKEYSGLAPALSERIVCVTVKMRRKLGKTLQYICSVSLGRMCKVLIGRGRFCGLLHVLLTLYC